MLSPIRKVITKDPTRVAFEAWYAPKFAGGEIANMPLRENGDYFTGQHQVAWMVYQVALAYQAALDGGSDS